MQAGLETLAGDVGVEGVGHRHDDRVEPQAEQTCERLVAFGNAVAVAHGGPHRGRGIGQRGELETLSVIPQEEGVRSLPHEARADQPDAQPRPARTH